jgi:hypothetical protein
MISGSDLSEKHKNKFNKTLLKPIFRLDIKEVIESLFI